MHTNGWYTCKPRFRKLFIREQLEEALQTFSSQGKFVPDSISTHPFVECEWTNFKWKFFSKLICPEFLIMNAIVGTRTHRAELPRPDSHCLTWQALLWVLHRSRGHYPCGTCTHHGSEREKLEIRPRARSEQKNSGEWMELQPDALTGCHTTTSGDIHVRGVNGNQQIGTLLGTPASLINNID